MTGATGRPAAGGSGARFTVSADRESCQGHARCWQILPELFRIDDDGYTSLGHDVPVPEDRQELARRAVASCPERALRMDPVPYHTGGMSERGAGPLAGQVAIVTGAGRGIGRAIAQRLAIDGARVGLVSRSASQLAATAEAVRAAGGHCAEAAADVRDRDQVDAAVTGLAGALGPVDLLVNNAGVNTSIGPVWEVDPDEWWSVVGTNLRGPFLCSRAVLPDMLARRRGRIVNIVSQATLRGAPYDTAYACSKTALIRFTDSLAAEVAQAGIRVFALSPGSVHTELTDGLRGSDAGKRWLGGNLARLTFVPPELAADAVAFLAAGGGDGLSGRFFHVSNDVRALAASADSIAEHDLYQLRWRTKPTPGGPL
jgi:NAD(P)-dependent dehydrogenase (short-subunit alcohol dehydrogenase family)/ferredoxin